MRVRVLSFAYVPGEYKLTQGHKAYERSSYKNGQYVNPTGFGWASEGRPSKIIVNVEYEGKIYEVWVDHYFKEVWGRMTTKRVAATVPTELEVDVNETNTGKIYLTASILCLKQWFARANSIV